MNEKTEMLWPILHDIPFFYLSHDDDKHGSPVLKHQNKFEHKQPVQQQHAFRPSLLPRAPPLLRSPVVGRQQQQLQPQSGNYNNNTPTPHYWPGADRKSVV